MRRTYCLKDLYGIRIYMYHDVSCHLQKFYSFNLQCLLFTNIAADACELTKVVFLTIVFDETTLIYKFDPLFKTLTVAITFEEGWVGISYLYWLCVKTFHTVHK